jgi:hypothetical protein
MLRRRVFIGKRNRATLPWLRINNHNRAVARGLWTNHSRAVARGVSTNHSRAVARGLWTNHSRAVAL